MHQLIPPAPIPPAGNPGAFVRVLCLWDGAFVHPEGDPREFGRRWN